MHLHEGMNEGNLGYSTTQSTTMFVCGVEAVIGSTGFWREGLGWG